MKSSTKHMIISTIGCALTLVIFLAFYSKLPESIPVHFDSAGNANSYWPRDIVVFGIPAACVLLNLLAGFYLKKQEDKAPFMFYIMPVAAVIAAVVMIFLGLK